MSLLLLHPPSPFPARKPNHPKPLLLRARSLPSSDDLLRSLSGDAEPPAFLPAVRSYENDLARLTLVGAVPFDQAVTAAAADGGDSAREHLSSGAETMVVEALFPGNLDEHSTVSTKLFLPAADVDRRSRKLRSGLPPDLLLSAYTSPSNILAMTFRQVTLQRLWNLELSLFAPGTERDMDQLSAARDPPLYLTITSSHDHLLASLAEAISSASLDDIAKKPPQGLLRLLRKSSDAASSADSSVRLTRLHEHTVLGDAWNRMGNLSNSLSNLTSWKRWRSSRKSTWWPAPTYAFSEKDDALQFSSWVNEFVPAYKVRIDGSRFEGVEFHGFVNSPENVWEVGLTHSQVIELANILDMFYEDRFTLPQKRLAFDASERFLSTSRPRNGSKWKMGLLMVAWGCLLVSAGIMTRLFAPHLLTTGKMLERSDPASVSNTCQVQSLGNVELEPLCISVVERVRDSLACPGEIVFEPNIGAWIGELPAYFKEGGSAGWFVSGSGEDMITTVATTPVDGTELSVGSPSSGGEDMIPSVATYPADKTALAADSPSMPKDSPGKDIASYQVVFTNDGLIVGFQPMNRVAVNYWAANPFAMLLYRRKKLSPGLFESGVRVPRPDKIILVELLMSVNQESRFALARPFKL